MSTLKVYYENDPSDFVVLSAELCCTMTDNEIRSRFRDPHGQVYFEDDE